MNSGGGGGGSEFANRGLAQTQMAKCSDRSLPQGVGCLWQITETKCK